MRSTRAETSDAKGDVRFQLFKEWDPEELATDDLARRLVGSLKEQKAAEDAGIELEGLAGARAAAPNLLLAGPDAFSIPKNFKE